MSAPVPTRGWSSEPPAATPPRPVPLGMRGHVYFHIANLKANVDATSTLQASIHPKHMFMLQMNGAHAPPGQDFLNLGLI